MQRAQLQGITNDDIQRLFEEATGNRGKSRVIFLDASYAYTFHLDDFEIIRKFCILGRYDLNAVLQWHVYLERWLADQTVFLADRQIKPIEIVRSFDKIVNEGLEQIAAAIVGSDIAEFPWRGIGDGVFSQVLPSDRTLSHQIDRINVFTTKEGGSLSRDGSTIYSVGNHPKSTPTPANGKITECGMMSAESAANDLMFDHSKFPVGVNHTQNADAPGTSTVIYMCSA